jgi:hypothetical protein
MSCPSTTVNFGGMGSARLSGKRLASSLAGALDSTLPKVGAEWPAIAAQKIVQPARSRKFTSVESGLVRAVFRVI